MYRVHIDPDWLANGNRIYIVADGPPSTTSARRRILRPGRSSGDTLLEDVDPAVDAPPSLWLPDDALEALVERASDVKPPSSAMAAHLADAIAIRDDLLDLVLRHGRAQLPGPPDNAVRIAPAP